MRLFIAIEIPESIRSGFAALLKEFRVIAPQLKWVRAENLHVTLKFLGETDSANWARCKTCSLPFAPRNR